MHILDLSKVLIYESHQDYFKSNYRNSSRLLFTDTESFLYEIKTEDIYEGFSKDKQMFDFSSYSIGSQYYEDSDMLISGEKKDKAADFGIEQFVGIKPNIFLLAR